MTYRHRTSPAGTRAFAALLAAIIVTAWAGDARAACLPDDRAHPSGATLPYTANGRGAAQSAVPPPGLARPIVGLWSTEFRLDNGLVHDQSFQLFHADGTEMMISNGVPPVLGNVCVGIWRLLEPRTVRLRHMTWNWNEDGTLAGTFLMLVTMRLDVTGTVSRDDGSPTASISRASRWTEPMQRDRCGALASRSIEVLTDATSGCPAAGRFV